MRNFGLKYKIEWATATANSVACKVGIFYPDYAGAVTSLTPSDAPFQLQEKNDNDPLTPVRGQNGNIGILIENEGQLALLSELIPDTFNTALVIAYRANVAMWMGFVNPVAFSQPWVAPPFAVQIPVYDIVQSLYYERMPTDLRVGSHNFAELFVTAIRAIIPDCEQDLRVMLESDFSDNNEESNFMRYHVPSMFYFEYVNNDSEAGQDYSGITYGKAFEYILQAFGMCLRNYGNCLYFSIMIAPRGNDYSRVDIKHTPYLTIQDVDGIGAGQTEPTWSISDSALALTDNDMVRDDGAVSINQSANGIKVKFSIKLMNDITYILIPKYDEEDVPAVTWPVLVAQDFAGFPSNCQGYAYNSTIYVSVYQETDVQSPFYGWLTALPKTNFGSSGSLSDIRSYLGQSPGTCPTFPQTQTSEPGTPTNIVVGAIMCRYKRPDDENMKTGVFVSAGINSAYQSTAPIIYTMQTPAEVSLKDGTLKLTMKLISLRNYPFSSAQHPDEDFSLTEFNGYINVALSVGNWRYTGNAETPWTQDASERMVQIRQTDEPIEIPVTTELAGIVKLSLYGLITGDDYEMQTASYAGYSDLFHIFSTMDVTFSPNQSSETANDRSENLYYEEAAGYGDNQEILLSIGSDQNNMKANNILMNESDEVLRKIVYNDGTTTHPERHLARRAALYFAKKQAVYEFTADRRDYDPTKQVTYRNGTKALIVGNTDWLEDTDTIKLIEQKD